MSRLLFSLSACMILAFTAVGCGPDNGTSTFQPDQAAIEGDQAYQERMKGMMSKKKAEKGKSSKASAPPYPGAPSPGAPR